MTCDSKLVFAAGRSRLIAGVIPVLFFVATPSWAQDGVEVASPGGVVKLTLEMRDGEPTYSVERLGADILSASQLGVRFSDGASFDTGLTLTGTETATFDGTWTQVWGEKKDIRNHYNELRAALQTGGDAPRRMDIVFRVYDDGFFDTNGPNRSTSGHSRSRRN